MNSKKYKKYKLETKASTEHIEFWEKLYKLFNERPISDPELMVSLGLYMRSSALAKILFLNELYEKIVDIPGVIVEFGCWLGQNLVVFENLRAIYEPFNQSRRIMGFDTFGGYPNPSEKDRMSETIREGYTLTKDYKLYLEKLIDFHEKNNVLGNIKKHQVIDGDVRETVPRFFEDNPETVVALAYFDLALYEPTKKCLEAIKPHLIKGSVVMLDEFNSKDYPGETIAFNECFRDKKYSVRKSVYIPDRTLIIMD